MEVPNLWMLFEAKHLKKVTKNFNIALTAAATENLLGMLAGDVAYKIGAGAGIHLRFRKDTLVSKEAIEEGCFHVSHVGQSQTLVRERQQRRQAGQIAQTRKGYPHFLGDLLRRLGMLEALQQPPTSRAWQSIS